MSKYNITTFYYSEEFNHTFDMFMELIKKDPHITNVVGLHKDTGDKKKKGALSVALRLLIEKYVDKNKHLLVKGVENASTN